MSDNYTPISRARKLRKNMTDEENLLWQKLRGRKFIGLKFLRQHPIVYDSIGAKALYFIPDFYCAEKKLIIELDGPIHTFKQSYDKRREEILTNMGFQIIRFENDKVKNIGLVLKEIKKYIDELEDSP